MLSKKIGVSRAQKLVALFSIGLFLQVVLIKLGLNFANFTLSNSSGGELPTRVFVFPLSASIIVFYYLLINRQYILMLAVGSVLFFSGSKSVLTCILLICISYLKFLKGRLSLAKVLFFISSLLVVSLLVAANPVSSVRLLEFKNDSKYVDHVRELQISQTKNTVFKHEEKLLFGSGFIAPIKPTVDTNDKRWFENSRFDVENGYWMLVAKVGFLGAAYFLWLVSHVRLPLFGVPTLLVGLIMSIGSSSILFNMEGVFFIAWVFF